MFDLTAFSQSTKSTLKHLCRSALPWQYALHRNAAQAAVSTLCAWDTSGRKNEECGWKEKGKKDLHFVSVSLFAVANSRVALSIPTACY